MTRKKLSRSFYLRDVVSVARALIGKTLVVHNGGERFVSVIVETEAYDGKVDEASHAFRGKRNRNRLMFEEGGRFYVYFTYGMHYCCNITAGEAGHGAGALLRGVEPVEGIAQMALNRFGKTELTEKEKRNLTSGPGKLSQAMGITFDQYGLDVTGDEVCVLATPLPEGAEIVSATRIGIKKAVDLPWRFYLKNNPYVSRK